MHVFLLGASGFVGREVLQQLTAAGHTVVALVRSNQDLDMLTRTYPGVSWIVGDLKDPAKIREQLPSYYDATIYLPGLIREFPRRGIRFEDVHVTGVATMIEIARERRATRWIHMSALGVGRGLRSGYYDTKLQGEATVQTSGLEWTIFRPSVMFSDSPTDRYNFVSELASAVRMAPFIPVLGHGRFRMQPISVREVAKGMAMSLTMPETNHTVYELGGPDKIAYKDLITMVARAMGSKKPVIHIPLALMKLAATLLDRFAFFPITRDQLTMLVNENIVNDPREEQKVLAQLGLPRQRFVEALSVYFAK